MAILRLLARGVSDADRSLFAATHGPLIRGYFLVAAAYYAIMAVAHFFTLAGTARAIMTTTATVAAITAMLAPRMLRRESAFLTIEMIVSGVNLLVLINVFAVLRVDFDESKLVYFVVLVMVFALASVSLRQALVSIAITFAVMFLEVQRYDPSGTIAYGFVAFGAATSAIAIAHYLRRTIELTAAARRHAEAARENAEVRLHEAEQLGEELRRQSRSDSLTGLSNRRAFFEAFARARHDLPQDKSLWLILLDLDGFKAVNDNYGHLVGDELLKTVAHRLKHHCGDHAHVSRIGGDEFNIILFDVMSETAVSAWCEDLLAAIAETYVVEDRLVQISGSIGCYLAAPDDNDPVRKADFALLNAKRTGKNRVVVFREEHARDAAERFHVEQALRVADYDAEIELVFQPQIDLATGRITCAEALARWNSPTLGMVSPSRFIEIAEESGLIAKISLTVLAKLLATFDGWDEPVTLSMNLSGHDLMADHMIDRMVALIAARDVPAQLIEFEVTETAMMPDIGRAHTNLQRLSARGHPIALDDFGTGYSNFSYLRTLPIGKMKVDRSFIEDMGDPMTEKMLRSLVGMARTLDVDCLLEGIENELELLMAKRVGAGHAQGFLFGQPMSADELKHHVAAKWHDVAAAARPRRSRFAAAESGFRSVR